jgi:prepilin-type N-terminal cleavage/methylation domain-containing protein
MALAANKNILSRRCFSGFTLIELLVVVATISLLLAIMLPVLGKVRIVVQRVICRSNLKQIALAWQMYLDDNQGRFYYGWNADVDYGGWKGDGVVPFPPDGRVLNKHVRLPMKLKTETGAEVFKCPADNSSVYSASDNSTYWDYGTSYRTNVWLIGPDVAGWLPSAKLRIEISKRLKKLNRNKVTNPARVALIGDYGWADQWYPDPTWSMRLEWHHKCCHHNVAFLDCHVEFLKIRKGLYVTPEYSVLPFKELFELALGVQDQIPCPLCD